VLDGTTTAGAVRARFRRPAEREISSVIGIEAKVIPHHRPLLDYHSGAVVLTVVCYVE
jgi:hypothetical protein